MDVRRDPSNRLDGCRIDGEAVVLTGDLDATRLGVEDRLVRAAVAELELIGLAAGGERRRDLGGRGQVRTASARGARGAGT